MLILIFILQSLAHAALEPRFQVLLKYDQRPELARMLFVQQKDFEKQQQCRRELQSADIPFACYQLKTVAFRLLDPLCKERSASLQISDLNLLPLVSKNCRRILQQQKAKILYIEEAEDPVGSFNRK